MLYPGCSYSYKRGLSGEESVAAMRECAAKGCRRCQNGLGQESTLTTPEQPYVSPQQLDPLTQVEAPFPQEPPPQPQKPTKYYRGHAIITMTNLGELVDDGGMGGRVLDKLKNAFPDANVHDFVFQLDEQPTEADVKIMGNRKSGPHDWWDTLVYGFRAGAMLQRKLNLVIKQHGEIVALRKRHSVEKSALDMEEQLTERTSNLSEEDQQRLKTEFMAQLESLGIPGEEKFDVFIRWLARAGFRIVPY